MIDGIISTIIVLPIMCFTGGFESIHGDQQYTFLYTSSMGVLGVLIFIIIHGKLLARYGQTVGKKILKIKITDLDGNLPSIKKHILPRYAFSTLVAYIPIIGGGISLISILFIFGKSRRCIHDQVGKTIIIDA